MRVNCLPTGLARPTISMETNLGRLAQWYSTRLQFYLGRDPKLVRKRTANALRVKPLRDRAPSLPPLELKYCSRWKNLFLEQLPDPLAQYR